MMMFGEVVTKVGATGFPVHEELILAFLILNPIELYVDSFGALLFNGVVEKPSTVELSTRIGVGG